MTADGSGSCRRLVQAHRQQVRSRLNRVRLVRLLVLARLHLLPAVRLQVRQVLEAAHRRNQAPRRRRPHRAYRRRQVVLQRLLVAVDLIVCQANSNSREKADTHVRIATWRHSYYDCRRRVVACLVPR